MSNKYLKFEKYQLYFDRDKKIYIEFDSKKIRNCRDIYNLLGKEIEQKIEEIYGKEKDNKKFNFILIESKLNNKSDSSSLIELKLNVRNSIYNYMNNKQYYLCYLPINNNDINLKKNKRNKIEEKSEKFIGVELDSLLTHNIEKYLNNEGIYWLDKKKMEFLYGKGNVDEKTIEVSTKLYNIKLKISAIRKEEYFENKIPTIIEGIKAKIPNFIIIIYHNNVSHIFGLYHQKSYLIWKNAIKLARIKFNNFNVHSTFNSNITTYNYQQFIRSQSIPTKLFSLNQIMENPEKREIFLEQFQEKKIADIISNIYSYKINISKNKYFEAWICLKKMSFYVNFNNIQDKEQKKKEIEKYSKIFTPERINLYNNTVIKANEEIGQIKDLEHYEQELNNALKKICEKDLFDKLYDEIYVMFIEPNYQKIQNKLNIEYKYDKKPIVVKRYHLLLSKYCTNYFDLKNINNFNCLCSSNSNNNNINDNEFHNFSSHSNKPSKKNLNLYKSNSATNSSKSLPNDNNQNF